MAMRKGMYLCISLFLGFFLLSPLQSQRKISRPMDAFNKLDVFGNVIVYITKGSEVKFELEVPDDIDPTKVSTSMEGKTLKIRYTQQLLKNSSKIKVFLTYTEIQDINIRSSAEVFGDSVIKGERLVLNASTGSNFDITVDVGNLDVKASDGSVVVLTGFVKTLDAETSMNATLSAYELDADEAFVRAHSNSKIKVNAEKALTATASSGGYIGYLGNPPQKTITTKMAGKVERNTEE